MIPPCYGYCNKGVIFIYSISFLIAKYTFKLD